MTIAEPAPDTPAAVEGHVRRNTYRDSVELMRVAAELERLPDIQRAALVIGHTSQSGHPRGGGPAVSRRARRGAKRSGHRGGRSFRGCRGDRTGARADAVHQPADEQRAWSVGFAGSTNDRRSPGGTANLEAGDDLAHNHEGKNEG